MANFETSPEFTEQIRKFETVDPAHADLFNGVIGALLNNDVFLKNFSDQLIKKIEQHATDKDNPHGTDKDKLGIGKVNNTSDDEKPVSIAQQAAIDAAYQQSTGYTNQKIADLINGAPNTLDTLGEIAKAMQDNANVVDALETAIGTKANQAELNDKLDKKGDASNTTVVFSQAATRKNIESNEEMCTVFGKIKKFFFDLKEIAFSGSYNDLSDKPTIPVNMTAATASTAGKTGLVPAPPAGAQTKYFTGAGTFENVDDHAVIYTSGDTENPTGWADIALAASGEKLSSLARKLSLSLKNMRYLRKIIGSTDISAIGNGTITGAINLLNSSFSNSVRFNTEYYTGNTTTTQLMTGLTAPCICLTSTECITDKPTGKYGTIVIFKFSSSRISALCISTDGSICHNAWNASSSTITGWK